MDETNAWNTIPLGDYEHHMQHDDVGQAQLLNRLTGNYHPQDLLFLGISGGNGLEHVDKETVRRVCGIDINDAYLRETHYRFGAAIKQVALVKADLDSVNQSF